MDNKSRMEELYDIISDLPLAALSTIAPTFYNSLNSELEKQQLCGIFISRAEAISPESVSVMKELFRTLAKGERQKEKELKKQEALLRAEELPVPLDLNSNGSPELSVQNFYRVMSLDPYYKGIRFNELKNAPEIHETDLGKVNIRSWTDADEAFSVHYIESTYHLYSEAKHQKALTMLFNDRIYNPLLDILNALPPWDGEERLSLFLHRWMGVEDSPYSREVSRLIFAGGISRAYHPGCKFDEVPVLVGTKQGEGKSSIVRFLAIHDNYYSEVTQFEGKEAVEQLEGAWICEISEMLAMTKAKETESVKAFCSRQSDKYRKPYSKNSENIPRRCMFIGTTNNARFLKDKTGNRRFYPVNCVMSGYDLLSCEQEVRDYILLCWAEARDKFRDGKMPPYADRSLMEDYHAAQENAMEDDWREDAIRAFLEREAVGNKVCIRQLMREALTMPNDIPRDPTRKDSHEIGLIMDKMPGWKRMPNVAYINAAYQKSRGWIRIADNPDALSSQWIDLSDDDSPLPF